jgi:hypothetical protein
MTPTPAQHRQRQILLGLLLFLVGQFALALHSHDLSLHSVEAEKCAVCLVTSSDGPAPTPLTPELQFYSEANELHPLFVNLTSHALLTPSQPRAPPYS